MVYRRGRYYRTISESNSQGHERGKTISVGNPSSPMLDNSEMADPESSSAMAAASRDLSEAYQVPLEVYDELEKATTPEQRTEIVLRLIEEHPHGRLVLSAREGRRLNLEGIDLCQDTLRNRFESLAKESPWWYDTLQGANLGFAEIQGANLENADLQGANMELANLQGAKLRGANLRGANLELAKLQGTNLQGATLGLAKLQGAYLQEAYLQGANLQGAKLQGANLQRANLQGAKLQAAKLQGVDLSLCVLDHTFFCNAWLDRTRLQWEQIGGAIGEEAEAKNNLQDLTSRALRFRDAKRGYLVLKQNFDDLGDYDASSKAYRKERRMERMEIWLQARVAFSEIRLWASLKGLIATLSDLFVAGLCDYGESVWRVVGWIAALLLVIGPVIVTILGGLRWPEDSAQYLFGLTSPILRTTYSYFQYFLYILDAFTTASFSRLEPVNDFVRLASGLIAFIGIVLAGLLGFVAGNRIRRS